jgi:hypothetical protein
MAESSALSLSELEQFDSRARSSGRERRFCCPFCGGEKPMDSTHRSLCVNTESGAWNCKRCGAAGKLKEFWEDKGALIVTEKCRRGTATRRAFATAPPPRHDPEPSLDSVEGYKRQRRGIRALSESPGEAYLISRGIPLDLAKSSHCKYAPSWGRIGSAVVFPVFDAEGKGIAAAGRALEGSGKQTFGPKSLGVFSTPRALDADPVAITEAPIDALSLALAGLPSVALCGTSGLPSWLITRLAKSPEPGRSRTVYLAFDDDQAGDTAAAKIEGQLSLVRGLRLRPQGAKDWNAMLTGQGLDSLRCLPDIARLGENAPQPPPESLRVSEAQAEGVPGACMSCGLPVVLQAYPEGNGWVWYECDSCEKTATVCVPDGVTVPESNPTTSFCDPCGEATTFRAECTPSEETQARIEALADRIRAALAGRSLPIPIKSGESITDLDVYALAEARSAASKSKPLSEPALDRLHLLGIDATT